MAAECESSGGTRSNRGRTLIKVTSWLVEAPYSTECVKEPGSKVDGTGHDSDVAAKCLCGAVK